MPLRNPRTVQPASSTWRFAPGLRVSGTSPLASFEVTTSRAAGTLPRTPYQTLPCPEAHAVAQRLQQALAETRLEAPALSETLT